MINKYTYFKTLKKLPAYYTKTLNYLTHWTTWNTELLKTEKYCDCKLKNFNQVEYEVWATKSHVQNGSAWIGHVFSVYEIEYNRVMITIIIIKVWTINTSH